MVNPNSSSASISVIVPHYDDVPNLIQCVSALAVQTIRPAEIVIVDNGSPCDLGAIHAAIASFDVPLVLIQELERGAGPARNAGVRASSGGILAFADGDVRPAPDWLERGECAMTTFPIVGGRVDVVPRDMLRPSPVEVWDTIFGFDAERFLERAGHLLTGNLFIRRSVFEAVGPFRNGIPEDLDWCHRAVMADYPLTYDSDLVVEHPAMTQWDSLAARWQRITKEQYQHSRERPFGTVLFWARSVGVLASIFPHVGKVLMSERVAPSAKGAVIAILLRVRFLRFLEAQRLVLTGVQR